MARSMIMLLVMLLAPFCMSVSSKYMDEGDLINRRKVFDRKRPFKKFKRYLQCQVCEFAAQSVYRVWLMTMNDKRFDEDELYKLVVESCNPWSNIGVWITAMDVVINDEGVFELLNNEDMGECNRECETIRSVCDDIITSNAEDIAEYIWLNKHDIDNPKLAKYMCPNACVEGGPLMLPKKLVKKFHDNDEEWMKMAKQEKQKRVDIFHEVMDEYEPNNEKRDL